MSSRAFGLIVVLGLCLLAPAASAHAHILGTASITGFFPASH